MKYKGYAYSFELDCDGDCTKILHDCTAPDGSRIVLDFCPNTEMTEEVFHKLVEINFPPRLSCLPHTKEDVLKM
jgi:hypothetical protein